MRRKKKQEKKNLNVQKKQLDQKDLLVNLEFKYKKMKRGGLASK